jgi:hypothetical protein
MYTEESLTNFDFWSGGKDRADKLTYAELETIEAILEDLYPDGMDMTQINDLFWFEFKTIAEWLGLTEDEILDR